MYITFDVGGTYVKHGVIKREGIIVEKGKYKTNCTYADIFIGEMKKIIEGYCNKFEIKGIAIAMPGIIDVNSGYMKETGAVLSLYEKNIFDIMKEITDLPVEVENDANCVALAEKFNGNGIECSDFICMTIGTGIGGGIVINNRIHHGAGFTGGEFGHMRISRETDESLHENSSMGGLINKYKQYMGIHTNEEVSGKDVFEAAERDSAVEEILERWFENISIAIYNLIVILNPQKVLIGGGVSERGDFLEKIKAYLEKNKNWRNVSSEISICKHKNDAGMLGALYHFLSKE